MRSKRRREVVVVEGDSKVSNYSRRHKRRDSLDQSRKRVEVRFDFKWKFEVERDLVGCRGWRWSWSGSCGLSGLKMRESIVVEGESGSAQVDCWSRAGRRRIEFQICLLRAFASCLRVRFEVGEVSVNNEALNLTTKVGNIVELMGVGDGSRSRGFGVVDLWIYEADRVGRLQVGLFVVCGAKLGRTEAGLIDCEEQARRI